MVAGAAVLNVVSGRLAEWTSPGLLLIGDAAHPMSPVGGPEVKVAFRDALIATNHLCPVRAAGGDPAARRVQNERLPEVAAAQAVQRNQARMLFNPDRWDGRLVHRLRPFMVRTGLLRRLHRREYRLMSDDVLPVRLVV